MHTKQKNIAILGSTGSVGRNTLDVVARNADLFSVVALGACKSVDVLLDQTKRFKPSYVAITDSDAAEKFLSSVNQLDYSPHILIGDHGLEKIASLKEVDCVMAAIVGAAGLSSTLQAARSGKVILLANKEALVMSGDLLIRVAHENNATLLPIDSEHNAVFQCMANNPDEYTKSGVNQVTLTASGGPFLNTPIEDLKTVTPIQACAHPNWNMGRKISIDSATMMNKGLELIEACLLFDLNISKVNVVIHPQSIVHAMVSYKDGSVVAHMGFPDMRVPIAHAIAWPERIESGVEVLDITQCTNLEFYPPDLQRFPCLQLAMRVLQIGRSMPAVMNAANEVAVQEFLAQQIKFTDIHHIVSDVVDSMEPVSIDSIETILAVDQQARELTRMKISALTH
ncbi:MAG: 1-deoxy-D-xylulose-5-phosphate reductoisomerase [Pseudomonadota bacterium]